MAREQHGWYTSEYKIDIEEPITKNTNNERNNTNLIVGNGGLVLQCTLS